MKELLREEDDMIESKLCPEGLGEGDPSDVALDVDNVERLG